MTVSAVRVRIAAMAVHIEGISTAYPRGPRTIPSAQLPALVVSVPSPALYEYTLGDSSYIVQRTYPLLVFVKRAAFGTENEYEELVETFIRRVAAYFFARPGLEEGGESLVYHSNPTGDASLQLMKWGDDEYIGTTVNLLVQEAEAIEYAD